MNKGLSSIQYLRALAVFLVVLLHSSKQLTWMTDVVDFKFAAVGVDIFFVVSGFIMVFTTYEKPMTPLQFMIKRVRRIVPLYWFYSTLLFVIAITLPSVVNSVEPNLFHFVTSLFFIPTLSPAFTESYWPILVPGWTLNYEMAFYVLFALTLLTKNKYRIPIVSFVMLLIIFIGPVSNIGVLEKFYSNTIILEFLVGMILGQLYLNNKIKPSIKLGLMFAGVAIMYFIAAKIIVFGDRFLGPGIASFILVFAALHLNFRSSFFSRILHKIGDASYSIYLSHVFTLAIYRFVWNKILHIQGNDLNTAVIFITGGIVSSLIVGWLSYEIIEKKITTKIKRD